MTKIREEDIETLVEFLQDWIDRRIISMDSHDAADAMNEIRARETFKSYLLELVGIKDKQ